MMINMLIAHCSGPVTYGRYLIAIIIVARNVVCSVHATENTRNVGARPNQREHDFRAITRKIKLQFNV